jgi:phosphopantothenoylcysteine decarboxylase / phosphopantothenate---cysteine ligase
MTGKSKGNIKMSLQNKKILLGVTGSIAAYKSAELVGRLRKAGAEVRVVMTEASQYFITPTTMETLSGNSVRTKMFEAPDRNSLQHIELAKWADMVVVAPASASFIARLACGIANDLLSTLCLATTAKIILAPAMNKEMWQNSITQQNVQKLKERKIYIWGPASGLQACGDDGVGRMIEPVEILQKTVGLCCTGKLAGKRVVITAGPTYEPIDPVRYIGNYSSGKMGFALAEAAEEAGAQVTLIAGPVHLNAPVNVNRVDVKTAEDMHDAVMKEVVTADIFISTAAVADFRPKKYVGAKIKKDCADLHLNLERNLDILADVARKFQSLTIVGFAAETDNVLENAFKKLHDKKVDMVVANKVGDNLGFGMDKISVTVCKQNGDALELPLADKSAIARKLIEVILNPAVDA